MDERRDDWIHGVDENLASLNAGQRVWEREFLAIRKMLSSIDLLIRGDPERSTSGLIGRMETLERQVAMVHAVLFVDSTGRKGLIHDVEAIMGKKYEREKTVQFRWQFWTAVTVAFISASTLLLTHWKEIRSAITIFDPPPVSQKSKRAKKPIKVKAAIGAEQPMPL